MKHLPYDNSSEIPERASHGSQRSHSSQHCHGRSDLSQAAKPPQGLRTLGLRAPADPALP